MPSTWVTEQQYAEITDFYLARLNRDLVKFIKTDVLKDGRQQQVPLGAVKTFLEVGPATGENTYELAPLFGCVDVIETNRNHAESLKAFNVCHDPLQEADIGSEKYDLILVAHVFYHIPRELWNKCVLKLFESLKPGGSMVLTMTAPRGPWEELQKSVRGDESPGKNDSGALLSQVKTMKLPYKVMGTTATLTAERDEYNMFHGTIRMFSWNQSELEDCKPAERKRVERVIQEFAKNCFDPKTNSYVMSQEEENIVIQKPF